MKKIALLLTILFAGALNGMEPTSLYELRRTGPEKMGAFGDLPKDVHNEIIKMALETSNNLDDAINAVKVAGVLQGARYDNLKDFTRLVHMLADKFNVSTGEVATSFRTRIASYKYLATKYLALGNTLLTIIGMYKAAEFDERFAKVIAEGADINISLSSNNIIATPLVTVARNNNIDQVKILLNAGANPHYKSPQLGTAFDATTSEPIKNLLREAMQKQQQ